ncbi:type 1 fimbria pilin [Aeromonas hydrophila]|uniref:fimbrial protein n=1 Tax=Aeromonas hydrophila TaxID=644 RepID=UPI00216860CE|nr:fimbrial protein [Aeromonas hydrophila]MCS3770600.1 type 1 fimbria pilin [Aeromonas hydrophila]MCS3794040.1 type 1 fimbria pilin [Aeromonas hydrophila]
MQLILAIFFWLLSGSVLAQGIYIPITGYIGENGCSVATESSNFTVRLGTMTVNSLLNDAPHASPMMKFYIRLEECGLATSQIRVKFSGEPINGGDPTLFMVDGGGATGVSVEILDKDLARLSPNVFSTVRNLEVVNGVAVLEFSARYLRTGLDVTPGSVSMLSTFTLEYL